MRLDMPLEEAMRTQRAIRRLKTDPVSDELLLHLVDLAIRAPSGTNAQRWEFVLVKDRAVKAQLARLNRQAMSAYLTLGRWTGRDKGVSSRILEGVKWQSEHFEDYPVIVVPCQKGPPLPFPWLMVTSWFGSIYPAVQNYLLAARAAGLGTTLITLPLWNMGRVRQALGLPWRVVPCCLVPTGWPVDNFGPTKRRPARELVHLDQYGNRPFA